MSDTNVEDETATQPGVRGGPSETDAWTVAAPQQARLGRAARRSWWLIALMGILLGGAGVVAGSQRQPEYSSEALLTVGQADLPTQTLPGYAQATQNLAGTYSRFVSGEDVLAPVARRNGLTYIQARDQVVGTRVPESSVFSIIATSPSRETAINLARQVAASTTAYIARLTNEGRRAAVTAFQHFQSATGRATRRRANLSRLRDQQGTSTRVIAKLDAEAAAAELIASTYAGIYQQARQPNAQGFKGAELLVPAVTATSDKQSYIERLGFVGLAVGLLFGLALAVLREGR